MAQLNYIAFIYDTNQKFLCLMNHVKWSGQYFSENG